MGVFGFRKKRGIIDLTKKYRQDQEKIDVSEPVVDIKQEGSQNTGRGVFSIFGDSTPSVDSTPSPEIQSNDSLENPHERKRKLAKRLSDMTNKMEELSNQIYHLTQRVELLERKNDINRY